MKIFLVITISIILLWNILLTIIIAKAAHAYNQLKELIEHNTEVFKEAMKDHVSAIETLKDSSRSFEENFMIIKNQMSEYKHKFDLEIDKINIAIDGFKMLINTLRNGKN